MAKEIQKREVVVIPPLEGLDVWEKILKKVKKFDEVVFLGNYIGSYNNIDPDKQLRNLKRIVKYAREVPKHAHLLIGGKDEQYISLNPEECPDFIPDIATEAQEIFRENADIFNFSHQIESCLFCTGGLSKKWGDQVLRRDIYGNKGILAKYLPEEPNTSPFRYDIGLNTIYSDHKLRKYLFQKGWLDGGQDRWVATGPGWAKRPDTRIPLYTGINIVYGAENKRSVSLQHTGISRSIITGRTEETYTLEVNCHGDVILKVEFGKEVNSTTFAKSDTCIFCYENTGVLINTEKSIKENEPVY